MSGLDLEGTSAVTVPVATATSLGVVSIGANLSVDENGVLSAVTQNGNGANSVVVIDNTKSPNNPTTFFPVVIDTSIRCCIILAKSQINTCPLAITLPPNVEDGHELYLIAQAAWTGSTVSTTDGSLVQGASFFGHYRFIASVNTWYVLP
jgi:hypothetical protein